ncbi:MAG TPA: diphosphomevalonate decarboxylase [Gammaproteobacteria bacterium]|nr:diphosphomevalonate decarboxylase [Gammaproteobacteria bacterium]
MQVTRQNVVRDIIKNVGLPQADSATEYAASNIALCKYWGKRDAELNLPVTSSLSISMSHLGACAKISLADATQDQIFLNSLPQQENTIFYKRLVEFLDLFRPTSDTFFKIHTKTNIPVGAGLASSACGFAATVKALDALFGWNLPAAELSILARLGSGSACRSIYDGFVLWQAGTSANGMDSFAVPLDYTWDDLRVGVLLVDKRQKSITSRDAMQATVESCPFYKLWPSIVSEALVHTEHALQHKDFWLLGATAEANAMAMHALMLATTPAVIYSQAATLDYMQQVWRARSEGIGVFFTQDAGPNLKLLFLSKDESQVRELFNAMEVVAPFVTVMQTSESMYD